MLVKKANSSCNLMLAFIISLFTRQKCLQHKHLEETLQKVETSKNTLPQTNSEFSLRNMDGWNTILSFWDKRPIFQVQAKLLVLGCFRECTLPETNIAPEKRPSHKETNLPTIRFQVQAVSFRYSSVTNPIQKYSKIHSRKNLECYFEPSNPSGIRGAGAELILLGS